MESVFCGVGRLMWRAMANLDTKTQETRRQQTIKLGRLIALH